LDIASTGEPTVKLRAFLLLPLVLALSSATAQRPPDTVFLEELTWDELRSLLRAGRTTVIIATAGTEQKGPHMVMGEHKFVLQYTTEKIARAIGNTIVAPIITYVPEGSWENPRGHMAKAGTITLPEDRFKELLMHAARSLKAGGFRDLVLIGDSGGNQNGMRDVAAALNTEWKDAGVRVHFIGDYYTKAAADIRTYLGGLGFSPEQIGRHAGMVDTSELMFVNPALIRRDRLAPGGGFPESGVNGDPTKATPQLGEALLRIKIDNAVSQIRASMARPSGQE
jgi:creatinine amidohydrolase/Fe(II)-dependent formamide hydrolase-like protein